MDVALIPPYSMMHTIVGRRYYMLLPSSLTNLNYRAFHNDLITTKSYVILDNGMFEDSMMSNDRLIDLANMWQVDEVVMPDVRGDMEGTLKAVDQFLNMFTLINFDKTPSLMVVIQVQRKDQIEEFLQRAGDLERLHFGRHGVFTYGIPRRLAEDIDREVRIRTAAQVCIYFPNNHIHLLGYARTRGVNEIAALSGMVRSIDTDAPYVWAANHALLGGPGVYERPERYMDMKSIPDTYLQRNIATLNRWSSGRP
jgi:hypothetical protein